MCIPQDGHCYSVLCCAVLAAGALSSQARHPIWGEYASSLLSQGVSRPKVCC
jgi:hypothetical protein